jgi:cholesterol transport system auxiliary component
VNFRTLFQLILLLALSCTLSFALSGCALTSKGTALSPRFFSPDSGEASTNPPRPASPAPASSPLALRLGGVEAASHIEERMSYRLHGSELGYHDDRRWTERPEEYVRRALESELFERRGVRRIVAGTASTLDVELTAFEELRGPPARVRLSLRFTLHDEREASLERSLTVERPLGADAGADHAARVASALGAALNAAVTEVSERVTEELVSLRQQPDEPAAGAVEISGARAPLRQ